ncbi:PilZ domain-containing protein [Yoonia sp. R2331]|uniref:PilZ domain-containing protein n=1 Tax=Yoonia sp. R2331 TaxID=3237238 RepID=UPI0034E407B9
MQQYRRHRYPTSFPVQAKTPFGVLPGKVLDVNEHGAQIKGLDDLSPGDKVMLQAGGDQIMSVVRWVAKDRVGVMFRPMLTIRQVDALRYAKRSSSASRFSSVGLMEMR